MKTKTLTANTIKTAKGFTATITTETIDRDGEVLVPDGMYSKNYDANPVLLWMHDPEKPIGRSVAMRRNPRDIAMSFEFAKRPENWNGDWLPDYLAGLVSAGVLNAVSVGFRPLDGGYRRPTKGDFDKYGSAVQGVYSKWELLEVSLVSIPANQEALITAVQKGYITASAAKEFGGVTINVPAKPTTIARKHVVSISVPKIGQTAIEDAIGRAMAKKSGRIWY